MSIPQESPPCQLVLRASPAVLSMWPCKNVSHSLFAHEVLWTHQILRWQQLNEKWLKSCLHMRVYDDSKQGNGKYVWNLAWCKTTFNNHFPL
jgi:hypothetical protein